MMVLSTLVTKTSIVATVPLSVYYVCNVSRQPPDTKTLYSKQCCLQKAGGTFNDIYKSLRPFWGKLNSMTNDSRHLQIPWMKQLVEPIVLRHSTVKQDE